jgi:enoyl-[acyl-carrier protein] reductase II
MEGDCSVIHTPLCDLLGIAHPILQGGMAWVATAELSAAVSEAGGLGIIGGGNAPTDYIRQQIHALRKLTDKPFGVNVPLFSEFVEDVIALCIEERVPLVSTGAGNPGPYMARLKAAGIIIAPLVASVALARRLEGVGADIIIAEGMESGGHIGDVTTLPLVDQVVRAVKVPVVAAGGLATGRSMAAALMLGAAGVQMGTRFICANECTVHPNYKQRIIQAGDRSTMVTGESLGHPVRALRNPMSRRFHELEERGATEAEVIAFGTGALRRAAQEGDWDSGTFMAGQSAGLVTKVMSCQAIIDEVVAEAEEAMTAGVKLIRAAKER